MKGILFKADWAEASERRPGDVRLADLRRTSEQRRADALVELVHDANAIPAGARRPRPLVSVYVDYPTVAGRLCELADGTVVTPGQLLPLFTKADVERVVFGPESRVIDLGETARFFTGATRRGLSNCATGDARGRDATRPQSAARSITWMSTATAARRSSATVGRTAGSTIGCTTAATSRPTSTMSSCAGG